MLAVEREVVAEFVQQQPGQQTDIGHAPLQYGRGSRWTREDLRLFELHDLADVFEDDIGAGSLREAVRDLLANDLIILRREARKRGIRQFNHFDWHCTVKT